MQQRPGPNRTGPGGWLQSLADGLKLAFKEDIMPVLADKRVYFIAPVISTIPAFVAFSVIPFGGEVSIFGEPTVLQLVDLPVGVLVVLACSSIGVYGIVLGGWASGSPYPLLAALRSAAQVISYEIALGLSIVGVILYAGSLSTADIVAAQGQRLVRRGCCCPSFVVFVIAMVGETNRAPFDLPEAESELVGGFHTEYTSLKFALFFLAEYVNMVTVSAMATTLFLGGGQLAVAAVVPQRQRLAAVRRVPDQDVACSCSCSSGCAGRCRGCATTSSCAWAGRSWCRAACCGSSRCSRSAPTCNTGGDNTALLLLLIGFLLAIVLGVAFLVPERKTDRRADRAGVGLPGATDGPDRPDQPATARNVRSARAPRRRRARSPTPAPTRLGSDSMFEFFKGFGVTFSTMFKKVVTEEYPEDFPPAAPRYHGRHQLNRHPDGLEKCVGCELCAWACPADAIYVEGGDNTEEARYSPG